MTIIMLAAGTSSRMGSKNKMLLPYRESPMVTYCCMQALDFLSSYSRRTDTACRLIVVTGYRRQSVEKALKPCKTFIEATDARLEMLIVKNPDYRNGQFSSAKTGVRQTEDGDPFFISLADMPLITAGHYERLVPLLSGHDAVRPFYETDGKRIPGHPVLHAPGLKEVILKYPDNCSVSSILRSFDVNEPSFDDSSWSTDIDDDAAYKAVIMPPC
ncbi:MAG: nucleotidyltransferase family protein [Spirochaetales bacterium]|nr:nucleotidyltransferase family protein [Spirochaetales bacterium]